MDFSDHHSSCQSVGVSNAHDQCPAIQLLANSYDKAIAKRDMPTLGMAWTAGNVRCRALEVQLTDSKFGSHYDHQLEVY